MKKLIFIVAGLFLTFSNAYAIMTVQGSCILERIVNSSQYAFCGKCTGMEVAVAENPSILGAGATLWTFKIDDDLKGNIGADTFTFKQAGTPGRSKWMPSYVCSAESQRQYCILLSCNAESGFCSPTGISCGKFDVRSDSTGRKTVVSSGVSSRDMLKGMLDRRPALSKELTSNERDAVTKAEDLDYDTFRAVVRKIINERKR